MIRLHRTCWPSRIGGALLGGALVIGSAAWVAALIWTFVRVAGIR